MAQKLLKSIAISLNLIRDPFSHFRLTKINIINRIPNGMFKCANFKSCVILNLAPTKPNAAALISIHWHEFIFNVLLFCIT